MMPARYAESSSSSSSLTSSSDDDSKGGKKPRKRTLESSSPRTSGDLKQARGNAAPPVKINAVLNEASAAESESAEDAKMEVRSHHGQTLLFLLFPLARDLARGCAHHRNMNLLTLA